jgi:FkbM family methyltransferase
VASARRVAIYAYEPMPEFFRLMQENIRLNGADGIVTCFNCAVGGNTQPRELLMQAGAFFPSLIRKDHADVAQTIQVSCTTLANILDENSLARVNLLKMDCEGAEYEILYNTPAKYTDRIEQIRMEYHNLDAEDRNADGLLKFLQSRNYRIEKYIANERVSGTIWARQK